MRALVLSGGSIKGAFQAGAIQKILHQGFVPEHIYGVSVGALNGALLANSAGQSEAPDWPAIGDELVDFWIKRITSFDVLGKERGGIGIGIAVLRKKFKGLLKMKKADKLIKDTVDFASIENFGKLFVGVVNIHSGKFILGHTSQGEEKFIRHLIASTHEPIIKSIIPSETGEPLADGGVRNIVPLKAAIDAGASEIIAIANQAEAVRDPNEDPNYRNLLTLAKRTISVMTNEIVNNDLKLAEYINHYCRKHGDAANDFLVTAGEGEEPGPHEGHRLVDIKVIRPKDPLNVSVTEFTTADIEDMIRLGGDRAGEAQDI